MRVRTHASRKGQSQRNAEGIIGMETLFAQDRVQVACLGNCSIEGDFFGRIRGVALDP
jgi:hypothetical protein